MRPRATHIHTYHAFVKNVTIAIDEATLREARRIAADRSTSLNAMIRECLDQLVARESRVAQARERILNLCRESTAERGSERWTRDELHERRVPPRAHG